MEYAIGTTGRVCYLRIDHGEDLIEQITNFVIDHEIKSGMIQLIGAIKTGTIVTGPEQDQLPVDPHRESISCVHELIGSGFIRTGADGPAIHIHVSSGRHRGVITGCLRDTARVFIVIEAVITELAGIKLPIEYDKLTGLDLPKPAN